MPSRRFFRMHFMVHISSNDCQTNEIVVDVQHVPFQYENGWSNCTLLLEKPISLSCVSAKLIACNPCWICALSEKFTSRQTFLATRFIVFMYRVLNVLVVLNAWSCMYVHNYTAYNCNNVCSMYCIGWLQMWSTTCADSLLRALVHFNCVFLLLQIVRMTQCEVILCSPFHYPPSPFLKQIWSPSNCALRFMESQDATTT